MSQIESVWRRQSAPIIRRVLAETAGKPDQEIRRALREAYPFGPRQYHPYNVWCDEIARQRGTKVPLGTRQPHNRPPQPTEANTDQILLFESAAV